MTKHKIDIKEPIWKEPRSVGLNIAGLPIDDQVEISISYKNKEGKLIYPDTWTVDVHKLNQYPAKKVRGGVIVNIVPICDLNNLILTKKEEKMLFDKKFINSAIEASQNVGGSKTKIAPGKHLLTVKDVTLSYAKSDNNPMIIVEFEKDENHWTIKEFFKIEGKNTDIARKKLIGLFHKGFGYEIKACKTEDDLLKQLVKFKDKQLSVAVRGQKKAISVSRGDSNEMIEVVDPSYWYCASASDFDSLDIDMSKAITGLSDEDKEKIIQFNQLNAESSITEDEDPMNSLMQNSNDDEEEEGDWFDQ